MPTAIIGANGFVGTRLLEKWSILKSRDPIAIVRRPASLAAIARFPIDWKIGDALDIESLTQALKGCETAVHAAIGDPKQIEAMPKIFLNAAARAGLKRVVYLSSASVHGQNPEKGVDESSPLSHSQDIDYNNAKVRAEQSFFETLESSGLEGCALRPGVVFGPRSRWISDLAEEFLNERAYLHQSGKGICNSIYIDNLVHAIERALEVESLSPSSYLLNDAETVTWREFYEPIAKAVGKSLADAHPLDRIPSFPKSLKEKTSSIVSTKAAQSILPIFPGKLKRVVKASIDAWPEPQRGNAWKLPKSPGPSPTQEMCLLQQCDYKFPNLKASQELEYKPPVSFQEGMRRSIAWLEFAGYPASSK